MVGENDIVGAGFQQPAGIGELFGAHDPIRVRRRVLEHARQQGGVHLAILEQEDELPPRGRRPIRLDLACLLPPGRLPQGFVHDPHELGVLPRLLENRRDRERLGAALGNARDPGDEHERRVLLEPSNARDELHAGEPGHLMVGRNDRVRVLAGEG